MKREALSAIGFILCAGMAAAQPYGWVPGTSADLPAETGNRIAVVDLGAGAVVGGNDFADGFLYTSEPGGADPLVPAFSPDGSLIYILVGGDADKLPDPPHGNLYVFDTNEIITKLKSATEPGPGDVLQHIVLEIPQGQDDPLEPVAQAINKDGTVLVMTEAGYDRCYIWDLNQDGTIDESSETILEGYNDPSPPMISNDGTRAYFTTQLVKEGSKTTADTQPQVIVINLTTKTEITRIDVPPPAQGAGTLGVQTIPFATCSFTQTAGVDFTAMQVPGADHADDSKLFIWSGYIGFLGSVRITSPFPVDIPFQLDDPFRIYQLDTSTNTLVSGSGAGGAVYDEDDIPGDAHPIFAPLSSPWKAPNSDVWLPCGSAVIYPPAGGGVAVVPTNSALMLGYGMMPASGDRIYIGSAQGIDGTSLISGGGLKLKDGPSDLYYYATSTNKTAATTLTKVTTVDRSITIPLGFVGDKVVYGSTDNVFLLPVGESSDASVDKDAIIGIYNPDGSSTTEVALQIAAGAYGQQPAPPANGRANGDFTNDGCTNINDFLVLLDNWQQPYPNPGDDAINVNDFLNMLDHWQVGCGA